MTNKIAMRRALAEHGVPQPEFAAVRTLHEARVAAKRIGFPSVLKAADSAGQRGLFLLAVRGRPGAAPARVARRSRSTRRRSSRRSTTGLEVNGCSSSRDGEPTVRDALRPAAAARARLRRRDHHVYPSTLFGDALEAVREAASARCARSGCATGSRSRR